MEPLALELQAALRALGRPARGLRAVWRARVEQRPREAPQRPQERKRLRRRNGSDRMTYRLSPLARGRLAFGSLEPQRRHREERARLEASGGLGPRPAQHGLTGGAGLVEPSAGRMDGRR